MAWFDEIKDMLQYRDFVKFAAAKEKKAQGLLSLDLRIAELLNFQPKIPATWKNGRGSGNRETQIVETMWFHFADKQGQASWLPNVNNITQLYVQNWGTPDTTKLAEVVPRLKEKHVDLEYMLELMANERRDRVRAWADELWEKFKVSDAKVKKVLGKEAGGAANLDMEKANKVIAKLRSHQKTKLDGTVRGGHEMGQFWFGGPVLAGKYGEQIGANILLVSSAVGKAIDQKYIGEAMSMFKHGASVHTGLYRQTDKKKTLQLAVLKGGVLKLEEVKHTLNAMGCKPRTTIEFVEASEIREAAEAAKKK